MLSTGLKPPIMAATALVVCQTQPPLPRVTPIYNGSQIRLPLPFVVRQFPNSGLIQQRPNQVPELQRLHTFLTSKGSSSNLPIRSYEDACSMIKCAHTTD
eukprot:m.79006 g.79006  ORF g.79006 m.79006 type:complete len:100 (-) comp19255_c0_seq1:1488-1787(-)